MYFMRRSIGVEVDGIETKSDESFPGLRVESDGPGMDRLGKGNSNFLVAVLVGLEDFAIFDFFPDFSLDCECNFNRFDPLLGIPSSLDDDICPVLRSLATYLDPLSNFTVDRNPGLDVADLLAKMEVNGLETVTAGELHCRSCPNSIHFTLLLLLQGQSFDGQDCCVEFLLLFFRLLLLLFNRV